MKKNKWLDQCISVAEKLYGVFPFEVLEKMYARKLDVDAAIEAAKSRLVYCDSNLDVFEDLGYDSGYFAPVIYEAGEEYEKCKAFSDDLHLSEHEVECLLDEQGLRPFYIPSKDEIKELLDTGMIFNDAYEALKKSIHDEKKLQAIWQSIYRNDEIGEVIEKAAAYGQRPADLDELNELAGLVMNCYNRTNKRDLRGWQPEMLAQAMGEFGSPRIIAPMSSKAAELLKEAKPELNQMGIRVDDEVGFGSYCMPDKNGSVKKVKVGRNDPCPCGSGKKYKKCHGRSHASAQPERKTGLEDLVPESVKRIDGAMESIDSAALFLPSESENQPYELYWLYRSPEAVMLAKKKLDGLESRLVKCQFTFDEEELNRIIVFDDELSEQSKQFTGKIPTINHLNLFFAIADADNIIIFVQ